MRLEQPTLEKRTIRFLTSDDFPPFSFRDPAGRITGFNVDLARAICEELKVTCTLRVKPFEELRDTLATDEADAIIAGLSTSDPANAGLAFSSAYLRFPARFVTLRGQIEDIRPESFESRLISVVAGSRHEAFLQKFFPRSNVASYPSPEAARVALRKGEVAAHFGDGMSLSFWLQGSESGNCCAFAPGTWIEPDYFSNGMAIAVSQESGTLRDALDFALQEIHESGRYEELYLRYFPISFY